MFVHLRRGSAHETDYVYRVQERGARRPWPDRGGSNSRARCGRFITAEDDFKRQNPGTSTTVWTRKPARNIGFRARRKMDPTSSTAGSLRSTKMPERSTG